MKRILKQGKVGVYKLVCPQCNCTFEYTIEEVLCNGKIDCPCCGLTLTVDRDKQVPYRYASAIDLSQFPDATITHDKEEYLGVEKA